MWKKYIKYINKLSKINKSNLIIIINKIVKLDLDDLDFKKISGSDNLFRIRSWKFRILFKKELWEGVIIDVNTRWDIYKK